MASRFLITGGGSVTWDASDTSIWSATSGGATGASVPGSGDTVTMDASSGGGTVTLGAAYNPTVQSITCGAFTGTFDDNGATITCNATGGFNSSGSGTRTLTMTGALVLSATDAAFTTNTITNLTANTTDWDISFTSASGAANRTFTSGAITFGSVTVAARTNNFSRTWTSAGGYTATTMTIGAGNQVLVSTSCTWTTMNLSGTQADPITIMSSVAGTSVTVTTSGGTVTWTFARDVSLTGSPTSVTNGLSLGNADSDFDVGFTGGVVRLSPGIG